MQTKIPDDPIFGLKDLADYLHRSHAGVKNAWYLGTLDIPYIKVGRLICLSKRDVDKFLSTYRGVRGPDKRPSRVLAHKE